jgi:hypothetical protein
VHKHQRPQGCSRRGDGHRRLIFVTVSRPLGAQRTLQRGYTQGTSTPPCCSRLPTSRLLCQTGRRPAGRTCAAPSRLRTTGRLAAACQTHRWAAPCTAAGPLHQTATARHHRRWAGQGSPPHCCCRISHCCRCPGAQAQKAAASPPTPPHHLSSRGAQELGRPTRPWRRAKANTGWQAATSGAEALVAWGRRCAGVSGGGGGANALVEWVLIAYNLLTAGGPFLLLT